MSRYWFWDWLEETGASTPEDVLRAMRRPKSQTDLQQRAGDALKAQDAPPPAASIVAGSGIDLTGEMACTHYECRIRQVDELIRSTCLYFETIVVADALSPLIVHTSRSDRRDKRDASGGERDEIEHAIRVLLYIKEIGAENLISFQVKGHARYCAIHMEKEFEAAGLSGILDQQDGFIEKLAEDVSVHVEHEPRTKVRIAADHPLLEHSLWVSDIDKNAVKDPRRFAADYLVRSAMSALLDDVAVAESLGQPLASGYPLHKMFMSERVSPHSSRVAFDLSLPVLEGIPVTTLLGVRQEESDAFDRFRTALRKAIGERTRLQPTAHVEDLARQIEQDILEPSLREIRTRLQKTHAAHLKKTGTGLGIGAILTTCGLLTGFVPAAAVGVATMAAGIVIPTHQRIDTEADVELADMFFLWKLTEHAHD